MSTDSSVEGAAAGLAGAEAARSEHPLAAECRARRTRLLEQVGPGLVLVPTSAEMLRSADGYFPFHPDPYFRYLTEFLEPEAVLVLRGDTGEHILFCRERDREREIWDGYRYGPEGARQAFALDAAYPIDSLRDKLLDWLGNQAALHYPLGMAGWGGTGWDQRVAEWLAVLRSKGRMGVAAPPVLRDVRQTLDAMRLIKSPAELDTMRRAAEISARAHGRAMQKARPGWFEYQVEAELVHEFVRSGARRNAYESIVASGPNACVLHYIENLRQMRDGELLLIDAGCELEGFASDITRTFPVNGRFSGPQRAVYQLVLEAQHAACAQARPGETWNAPHDAAVAVLAQGMLDLGLLQGSLDGVLEQGSYRQFYMHRTGHWLGRDTHDVGEYKQGGAWRTLEPGMVFTVEPGCYIRPAEGVPEAFWHIGVRIEDDLAITADGHEVLTAGVVKEVDDIEAWMRAR